MKILFLHNKYLIAGGEDVSTESEINLLKSNGHTVDAVFVNNDSIAGSNKISLAINTVWSKFHYKNLIDLIDKNNYDIIHVQNFFPQISPSIFYAAKRKGTKIVMSVRNYRLICPNALLFINNEICERCVGKTIPYPSLTKKCYKDNLLATAVVSTMLATHNTLGTWNQQVDGYISISSFVKKQLVKGGINENLIHVKHNFVSDHPIRSVKAESHFVYVGRLSTEKGISFLLKAFCDTRLDGLALKIIGEGPLVGEVYDAISKNPNISYVGKLPINETYHEISKARALIFPSQWHEPFGRTIIESFSVGTPVIGSSVGGVTELIEEGHNGFLFDSSSQTDFIQKILKCIHLENFEILRSNSRKSYEENFTSNINYKKVMDIYRDVLSS